MVKKFYSTVGLFLVAVVLTAPLSIFAAAEISNLTSEVHVNANATAKISETYSFSGETISRGSFTREINLQHPQDATTWYRDRYVDISEVSLKVDGGEVQPTQKEEKGTYRISWPLLNESEDSVYLLEYTLDGRLSYYDDGEVDLLFSPTDGIDELPVRRLSAILTADSGIMDRGKTCFVGAGEEMESCSTEVSEDKIVHSARLISSEKEFTYSQSFKRHRIANVILERPLPWILPAAVVVLLAVFGWIFYTNRKRASEQSYEDLKEKLEKQSVDETSVEGSGAEYVSNAKSDK